MSTEMHALKEELQQLKQQYQHAERRLRILGGLALAALVGTILIAPGSRAAIAQSSVTTLQQILNRLSALENKTQFVSIGKDGEMHIVGTNLHIENGLGATNGEPGNPLDMLNPVVNGKGNLIVGYNASASQNGFPVIHTGSHNLILGDGSNYSSYGGLIAGAFNTIASPYASVTGGNINTASGPLSSVSGGAGNVASGNTSWVSGGVDNTASGDNSSASGGADNKASGNSSFVSGGEHNTASGFDSSVSGGEYNTASGLTSSINGGGNDAGIGIVQSNSFGWSAGGPGNGGPGAFHSP